MLAEDQIEVIQRLRSAKGHLGAIIGMLEIGEPCEAIFHQLGAVQAALHAAGEKLLICQIKHSQEIIQYSTCVEDRVAEVSKLIVLYNYLTKYSIHNERSYDD